MIPPLLWQTWKTEDVPARWQAGRDSMLAMNPTWKHFLLTDADNRELVKYYYPEFLSTYDAFPYDIQRADAVRYVLMAQYGGVYCDLDYVALRPFDELPAKRPVVLSDATGNSGYVTNSFLASCKCPEAQAFWEACLDEMRRGAPWWAVGKHFGVLASTGPLMLQRVLKRFPELVDVVAIRAARSACSGCQSAPEPHHFLVSTPGQSWNSWDSHLVNFVTCHWFDLIILGWVSIWALSTQRTSPGLRGAW